MALGAKTGTATNQPLAGWHCCKVPVSLSREGPLNHPSRKTHEEKKAESKLKTGLSLSRVFALGQEEEGLFKCIRSIRVCTLLEGRGGLNTKSPPFLGSGEKSFFRIKNKQINPSSPSFFAQKKAPRRLFFPWTLWGERVSVARKSAGGERGWGGAKNAISSVLLLLLFFPRPLHGKSPNHEPACFAYYTRFSLRTGCPPPPHSSFSLLSNAQATISLYAVVHKKKSRGLGRGGKCRQYVRAMFPLSSSKWGYPVSRK